LYDSDDLSGSDVKEENDEKKKIKRTINEGFIGPCEPEKRKNGKNISNSKKTMERTRRKYFERTI